jgi:hypothetical protein
MHRDGYRPTDVVVSSPDRRSAKVTIVSTGEELWQSRSTLTVDRELVEGPRTVLYNPEALTRFAGIRLFDNRIVVNVNRDFQTDAVMATAWTIGPFSAAWLLLGLHNRDSKKRRRR